MGREVVIASETRALDDWQFDAAGNVLASGGEEVADWLAGRVRRLSNEASPCENHEDFGWEFSAHRQRNAVWLLVAMGPDEGTMQLRIRDTASMLARFARNHGPEFERVAESLRSVLAEDARFTNDCLEQPSR